MAFQRLSALCAAACLCLLTAAMNEPPSGQKPIAVPGELPVGVPGDAITVEHGASKAKIALYPGSRTYPDDLKDMGKALLSCSEEEETEVIDVDTDTCLSGEYYMRNNVKILASPSCADGSVPTLVFYESRHCTGSPRKVIQNLQEITNRCLWSEEDIPISSYYWSLIYRCDSQIDDTPKHQEATPTLIHQNVYGAPGSVRYHHRSTPPCHSKFANRIPASTLEPGNCNCICRLRSIEIISPAVCSNGTRARLALYEDIGKTCLDYMCNWGDLTLANAIMDVDDWMLNTCISMSQLKLQRGGLDRALGVMFYCDGLHIKGQDHGEEKAVEAIPTPRGPRVSHSECSTSAGRYQWKDPVRPQTFIYPEPMACMALPKGHQLRIHEKPSCPDGTTGRLATWEEPGCTGWPKMIQGVDTLNCKYWNLQSETSYMIWCASDGLTAEERKHDVDDNRAIVSTDQCPRLNMKPGWTVVGRDGGPTVRRVDADRDCVNVYRDDQLMVYGDAKCAGGRNAKLAKYSDYSCRGEPDRILDVASLMNTCTQICGGKRRWSCSVKFTCKA